MTQSSTGRPAPYLRAADEVRDELVEPQRVSSTVLGADPSGSGSVANSGVILTSVQAGVSL